MTHVISEYFSLLDSWNQQIVNYTVDFYLNMDILFPVSNQNFKLFYFITLVFIKIIICNLDWNDKGCLPGVHISVFILSISEKWNSYETVVK